MQVKKEVAGEGGNGDGASCSMRMVLLILQGREACFHEVFDGRGPAFGSRTLRYWQGEAI